MPSENNVGGLGDSGPGKTVPYQPPESGLGVSVVSASLHGDPPYNNFVIVEESIVSVDDYGSWVRERFSSQSETGKDEISALKGVLDYFKEDTSSNTSDILDKIPYLEKLLYQLESKESRDELIGRKKALSDMDPVERSKFMTKEDLEKVKQYKSFIKGLSDLSGVQALIAQEASGYGEEASDVFDDDNWDKARKLAVKSEKSYGELIKQYTKKKLPFNLGRLKDLIDVYDAVKLDPPIRVSSAIVGVGENLRERNYMDAFLGTDKIEKETHPELIVALKGRFEEIKGTASRLSATVGSDVFVDELMSLDDVDFSSMDPLSIYRVAKSVESKFDEVRESLSSEKQI